MGPTRDQITKRARRRRREARRSMKRARLREEANAAAAILARQKAIQTWEEEEERLESLRKQQSSSKSISSRIIRFSDQVQVTTIPTESNNSLPPPISSPIGLALMPRISDSDTEEDDDQQHILSQNSNSLPSPNAQGIVLDAFRKLIAGDFADDEDDDEDPEFKPPLQLDEPDQSQSISIRRGRPKRDIVKSLASAFDSSSPNDKLLGKRCRSQSQDNHQQKQEDKHQETNNKLHKPNSQTILQNGHVDEKSIKSPKKKRKISNSLHSPTSTSIPDSHTINIPTDNADEQLHDPPSPDIETTSQNPKKEDLLNNKKNNPSDVNKSIQKKRKKKKNKSSVPPKEDQSINGQTGEDKPSPSSSSSSSQSSSEDANAELDSMFENMTKKRAILKAEQAAKATKLEKQQSNEQRNKDKKSPNGKKKNAQGPSRYTNDGLRILSYDEIAADQPKGLNGNCPFDCSCCF